MRCKTTQYSAPQVLKIQKYKINAMLKFGLYNGQDLTQWGRDFFTKEDISWTLDETNE
jgi:hypothetical protein